jgi:hypothetical protein
VTYSAQGNGVLFNAGQSGTVTVYCDPGDTVLTSTATLVVFPLQQGVGADAQITSVDPATLADPNGTRPGVTLGVQNYGPAPAEVRAAVTCVDTTGDRSP